MINEYPWISKFLFSVQDDYSVEVEWDESDPELKEWCSWDGKKQDQFIIDLMTDMYKNDSNVKVIPIEEDING